MTAQEIRQKYLDFQKNTGHTILPRANLVPQDDPTTLFTGSGMQPLLPYLLGETHPAGSRVADSQTCLRAEDIEEVGDNRHTTFFEMLGNWSFGDYFKTDQLRWFFTFLVDEVGLDPNKLYVTCFIGDQANDIPKDEESAQIWQTLFEEKGLTTKSVDIGSETTGAQRGIKSDERIFFYDASKNWWSRAGEPSQMPEGEPGGPDSEVFYLFDSVEHDPAFGEKCHPNCDCGRFLEIGNSVFMQFIKTANGFDKLPKQNVDFGGGLERIAAAAADDPDVFKISLIWPVIERLQELTGKNYQDHVEAKRIISDHLRAAVWLAVDGVLPSNKAQGYVMRRLIRRAVLSAHELGLEQNFVQEVAPSVIEAYGADFKEVADNAQTVIQILAKEEKVFRQTLKKGVRLFEKEVKSQLDGQTIFTLYDTYGFPTELSLEQAKKRNIQVDPNWLKEFDQLMQAQRERSRTATKGQFKGGLGGQSDAHKQLHTATHLLYATLKKVLGDHVLQRGANITEERLRFDFEHPQKLTDEEKAKVEQLVNEQIEKGLPVHMHELPTDKALEQGALGQFGDKYGDKVKVYQMGEGDSKYSFEICGGPHVDNTAELKDAGRFKIVKEQSSSAGVRRIKAILQ